MSYKYNTIVFIITRADTIAGAQRHVFELSQFFQSQKKDVLIICGEGDSYTNLLQKHNIPHVIIPSFVRSISLLNDFQTLRSIRKLLHKVNPDIVSLHSSKAGLLGRFASVGKPWKVIFTAHGWAFTEGIGKIKERIFSIIELILSKYTDKIICVSEADRLLAIGKGINEKKLVTIHNGRHIPKKVTTFTESKHVKIIMVGRLDEQKDHETLFKALSLVDGFELTLVGDGPKKDYLKKLVEVYSLNGKIEFTGLTQDVHKELEVSDIFCLISNWEGFPRSTLEAMSLQLPVIVSDVGGASEAVISNKNGFVVRRGDHLQLAKYLELLINDRALREKMGKAGSHFFYKYFTFEIMIEKTQCVYSED